MKLTLCNNRAIVIDHLTAILTSRGTVISYYYCDYSDLHTLEALSILGCLIKQMLNNIEIPNDIVEQIDQCYRHGIRKSATEELVAILLSVIQLFSKMYIVIDS